MSESKMNFREYFSLKGRNVLVTGASGQLGAEIVSGLLDCGASVVASDISLDVLNRTSKLHNWNNKRVQLIECDVTSKESLINVYKTSKKPITSLIANAGVSVFEPFLDRPEASIDWVMDVNLKGTLLSIQTFVKQRKLSGNGGEIVNIGSHYGIVSPDPRIYTDCERKNSEIYGATKAGIIQMTKYYAVHAADFGIRTNAVSPGGIRNNNQPQGSDFQKNYSFRCPMGRMAETFEIVGAILFLISPSASYINGQNIIIDGGTTCW